MNYDGDTWEWVCPECGEVTTHNFPPKHYAQCWCQIKKREEKRVKKGAKPWR